MVLSKPGKSKTLLQSRELLHEYHKRSLRKDSFLNSLQRMITKLIGSVSKQKNNKSCGRKSYNERSTNLSCQYSRATSTNQICKRNHRVANSELISQQRLCSRALRAPACAFGRFAPLAECRVGMLCALRWLRCCLKAEMADAAEPQPSGAPGSNADPGRSCEAFCSPTARVHKAEGAQRTSLEHGR